MYSNVIFHKVLNHKWEGSGPPVLLKCHHPLVSKVNNKGSFSLTSWSQMLPAPSLKRVVTVWGKNSLYR